MKYLRRISRARRAPNRIEKRRRKRLCLETLEKRQLLAAQGLQTQYFHQQDLAIPAVIRIEPSIDFDWANGSPSSLIGSDHFSARWMGQIESQYTEPHSFIVNADDGARLWINGQLLIDQWDANSLTDATANIDLIAGRRYDIQLEYRETTGNASVSLEWSSPSLAREVVPTESLFPAQLGTIDVHQWTGIPGTQISDLSSDVNFPDSPSATSHLTRFETSADIGDNLGQRVSGYLHPPRSGPYTFYVAANEKAELWLSNSDDPSGKQLIATVSTPTQSREWDAASEQQSAPVYLVAGQKYFVEALHKEGTGADHLAVGWIAPSTSDIEVIPGRYLSPSLADVRIYSDVPKTSEGSADQASFRVVRNGTPTNQELTVNYEVSGDAINGVDYSLLSGSVTIPAGQDFVDLTVTPLSDAIDEGDESIVIELLPGIGYSVGYKSERTVRGVIQDDAPAPAGGASLWNGTDLSDFSSYGGTFTTESDPTYGNVIQAVVNNSGNPWSSQMHQSIDGPVSEGDILLVEFRTRAIGDEGQLNVVFEKAGSPYTKSLTQSFSVPQSWTKIQLPFIATESYADGGASLNLQLAYGSQTLQFTEFQLLSYGTPRSLAPETAFGLSGSEYGSAQTIQIAGQTFASAYEVETTSLPTDFWNIQAVERNDSIVADGDVMRFEFAVRATSGDAPQTNFRLQTTDDYSTLRSEAIDLTSDWQAFSIDVIANEDFDAGALQAIFDLGYKLQTFQVGGFHWTNLSNAVDLQDLPSQFPSGSYGGRDGTDGWRSDADDRIAAQRKAPLTINVTDANGSPLDGAMVSLRQNRHQFLFGSAINAYGGKLDPNGNATALKYQQEILRLFNGAVMENSHKWPGMLQNRQVGIDGANFADDNDLYLRGHNVIWPSRNVMPVSIWTEYDTRVTNDGQTPANAWLNTVIQNRITDVLTTFDGVITEWDVVNEPFTNNDVMDVLGDSVVLEWYQQVRDFDPNIRLALNDYSIFTSNGGDTEHRANFESWLGLLDNANLLDVIGVQSHFSGSSLTNITALETLINDYSTQFGEPIAITEFDITVRDEQLQADYLRDYMTMSFSQPAITEFFQWGFWQDSHWRPDAALYRSDFSIKPNGQAYEDLVFGRWWTDQQATSHGGQVVADAFMGDYDVIVQYDGLSYLATTNVDDSGNSSVTVNVPTAALNFSPIVDRNDGSIHGGIAETLTNFGVWFEPDHEEISWSATHGTVTSSSNGTSSSDGTWSWSFTPQQQFDAEVVTITATDARGASSSTSFAINPAIEIADVDYGDAPTPYPTTIEDFGASHQSTGPRLGNLRDSEFDGTPSVNANADDDSGVDDEDGVLFGGIAVNDLITAVNVELAGASEAKVDAWIDFNRDGVWDASEKILDDIVVDQPMQTLNYILPAGLTTGNAYARVRISTAGGLGPNGPAADGEVEDYIVSIIEPPTVESIRINAGDPQRSLVDSVRVVFDRIVDIDTNQGNPFQFLHSDSGEEVAIQAPMISETGGKTTVKLTFVPAGAYVTNFGSLRDGDYQLTIDPSLVTSLDVQLDGDHDGSPGDPYVMTAVDGLFRKYGDSDGDGGVGLTDFAAFRGTFGRSDGEGGYVRGLDSDGDGAIGLTDFATFRASFGN